MSRNDKKLDTQRGTNPQKRDINASQRVSLALKLRSTKMTYESIAHQCGYANASSCRKAILRELDRTISQDVGQLRKEELESLELLERECWRIFADKNREKGQLFAVDRILAIKDRRAKLMCLDKRPDEELTQQNYTKRIVLVPPTPLTGGERDVSNS